MDERERRLARNEALFREVNERINEQAVSFGNGHRLYEFVCECSRHDCTLSLELSVQEYEAVRANPARFAVRPEHFSPEIEDVAERYDRFWVVEKRDGAADYAAALDPRRAEPRDGAGS